jgi:hypothetical protein
MIDVSAEIEIAAEPTDVAAIMFDPHREPEWMSAVSTVDVVDPGIKPGARVRRTGSLLGRDVSWTTEVAAFHFPHVLDLRLTDGPLVGTLSYRVTRSAGGTTARLRTVGDAGVLGFLPEPVFGGMVRSALASDLERLKSLVEGPRA